MHPVHWTQSDGDPCPKVDARHYFNKSSATGYWTDNSLLFKNNTKKVTYGPQLL